MAVFLPSPDPAQTPSPEEGPALGDAGAGDVDRDRLDGARALADGLAAEALAGEEEQRAAVVAAEGAGEAAPASVDHVGDLATLADPHARRAVGVGEPHGPLGVEGDAV